MSFSFVFFSVSMFDCRMEIRLINYSDPLKDEAQHFLLPLGLRDQVS